MNEPRAVVEAGGPGNLAEQRRIAAGAPGSLLAGGEWAAAHHPFTSPRLSDLDQLESDPGSCRFSCATIGERASAPCPAASTPHGETASITC